MKLRQYIVFVLCSLFGAHVYATSGSFGVLTFNNTTNQSILSMESKEGASGIALANAQGASPLHGGGATLDSTVTLLTLQSGAVCTVQVAFNDKHFDAAYPEFISENFAKKTDGNQSSWSFIGSEQRPTPYDDSVTVVNTPGSPYECAISKIVGAASDKMGVFPTITITTKGSYEDGVIHSTKNQVR